MNNRDIVSDHLQIALLATPPHKAFLTYLIQMALAESKGDKPENFRENVEMPLARAS